MKKTFLLCAFLCLVIVSKRATAQVPNFTIYPQAQCYTGASTYTALAAVSVTVPGSTSYSWTLISAVCPGTINVLPNTSGSITILSFSCCGVFTLNCNAYTSGGVLVPGAFSPQTLEIVCPGGGTLNATGTATTSINSVDAICIGNSSSLSLSGVSAFVTSTLIAKTNGISYTVGNTNPILVTPTANTTYTMTGSTAIGCTVSATKTINVQKAELQISPTAINLCNGLPIAFTSTINTVNTSSYTTGTTTTGISWLAPGNTSPFATTANSNTISTAGSYSAVLTHSGTAGTCSLVATSLVNNHILNPLLGSPRHSVCPQTSFTLFAYTNAGTSYSVLAPPNNVLISTNPNNAIPIIAPLNLPVTYTLLADSAGCTGNSTLTIHKFNLHNLQLVSSPSSVCAGMPVTLTAMGPGTMTPTHYTFFISPTLAIQAGSSRTAVTHPTVQTTYIVQADSAGCVGISQGITVNMSPPLTINVSQSSPTTCIATNGSNNTPKLSKPVVLNASGATAYVWSPSIPGIPLTGPGITVRPIVTTQYTVLGSTAICSGTAVITISVIPQITIAITPTLINMCQGQQIMLGPPVISSMAVGPSSSFTYSWTEQDQITITLLGSTLGSTVFAMPQTARTYTLEVLDATGCVSMPAQISLSVSPCTEIGENALPDQLNVYPNPVKTHLSISTEIPPNTSIEIRDVLGKLILNEEIGPVTVLNYSIDVSDLPGGIYILTTRTPLRDAQSRKIIKE